MESKYKILFNENKSLKLKVFELEQKCELKDERIEELKDILGENEEQICNLERLKNVEICEKFNSTLIDLGIDLHCIYENFEKEIENLTDLKMKINELSKSCFVRI